MAINQYLFDVLRLVDPSADIVDENEPAAYALPPKSAGYDGRKSYPTVSRWGECIRTNCPFCGDTRRRLFFCHLAGALVKVPKRSTPIRFSSFVCVCHNEHCNSQNPAFAPWVKSLGLDKGGPLDLSTTFSPKKVDGYGYLFVENDDELPRPCYPLTSPEVPAHVIEYLIEERGFDPYTLQAEYGCGYSPNGASYLRMSRADYDRGVKDLEATGQSASGLQLTGNLWGDRIIIPIIQGRRLVGWQGRLVGEADPRCPKYFTSPRLQKNRILFNLDRAILGNLAVLVEGVFDAMRVGAPGMAMFGKNLSAMQMELLKLTFSQTGGCIVLLDPDAGDEADRLAAKLIEAKIFPRGVVAAPLPEGGPDPAECTTTEMRDFIEYYSSQLTPTAIAPENVESLEDLVKGFEELEDEDTDE